MEEQTLARKEVAERENVMKKTVAGRSPGLGQQRVETEPREKPRMAPAA
jgi:hypothetical protein